MAFFTERTGYLLSRVRASFRARLDVILAPRGLTTPQYTALAALEEGGGGLSNADMARACLVTPQTMLRIIENLEAAGLVARSPHPTHGRVLQIALTARGRRAVAAGHALVLGLEEQLVSSLSRAERTQLLQLLGKCAAALGSAA